MKQSNPFLIIFLVVIQFGFGQKVWHVLDGDFADPSIVRVGEDFYMTHSSYDYVPGLLIWHSKDLKNWTPVKYALNEYIGDVWAPDLVYYKNKFYIYFPASGTNWVITANDPKGEWTKPIELKTNGIDPGHIATPDGKRYLYLNNGFVIELTSDGLAVKGKKKKVYDGWPIPEGWINECFCLESPKLNYLNGYYYLTSAQGGTAGPSTSHMVVTARSENVLGPWENSPYNPVVHTWSSNEKWWSKGHGTIFDDANGNWFVVYHAYLKDNLNMGRHVLIEPIKWTSDDWFRLKRRAMKEPATISFDNLKLSPDSFESDKIKMQWQFSGIKSLGEVKISDGKLVLKTDSNMKVMHANTPGTDFDVTVELSTESSDLEYGLVMYYNEDEFVGIGSKNNTIYLLERGRVANGPKIKGEGYRFMKLIRRQNDLQVAYSRDGELWSYYPSGREISAYKHNILKGFRNLKVGVFCKGKGTLEIDNFRYEELTLLK